MAVRQLSVTAWEAKDWSRRAINLRTLHLQTKFYYCLSRFSTEVEGAPPPAPLRPLTLGAPLGSGVRETVADLDRLHVQVSNRMIHESLHYFCICTPCPEKNEPIVF